MSTYASDESAGMDGLMVGMEESSLAPQRTYERKAITVWLSWIECSAGSSLGSYAGLSDDGFERNVEWSMERKSE